MYYYFKQFASLLALSVMCTGAYGQISSATLDANADAQVYSRAAGTNYGTLATGDVWIETTSRIFRFYAAFDINSLSIPSNAIISSAVLSLTPTVVGEGGAGSSSFIVDAVTGAWTESTGTPITYTNQPAINTLGEVGTSTLNSGKREFQVKDIVQNHVNGTLTTTGFRIIRNPETTVTSQCQYNTREAGSTVRPKLTISWYLPYSITGATIVQETASGASNGSITPTIANGSGSNTYSWINNAGTVVGTSANLTGQAAGWYGLTVTGSQGDKFYMSFIIGRKCDMITVNFRQDPNFIDDAQLFKSSGTTNYGTIDQLTAGNTSVSSLNIYQTFIRYRLWFDAQNDIYSATQTLIGKAHSTQSNAAYIYRSTGDWDELTITYNNKPSYDNSVPAGTLLSATSSTTEPKTVNVTDFFKYWTNNPSSAFGYTLVSTIPSGTIGYQNYYSSDATTSSNRPYVTLIVDDPSCDRSAYVVFKQEQDGSMVLGYKSALKVSFVEEYQQDPGKKWPMKLYDYNRQLIAAINYDGSAVGATPLLPAVEYVYGDNRAKLNLSSYSLTDGGSYILELTKSTGEKEYIEFIYKN